MKSHHEHSVGGRRKGNWKRLSALVVAGASVAGGVLLISAKASSRTVAGFEAIGSSAAQACLSINYTTATNTCSTTISVQVPVANDDTTWKRSIIRVRGGGSGQNVQCSYIAQDLTTFISGGYVGSSVPFRDQDLNLGDNFALSGGPTFLHCLMDPGTALIWANVWHPAT